MLDLIKGFLPPRISKFIVKVRCFVELNNAVASLWVGKISRICC